MKAKHDAKTVDPLARIEVIYAQLQTIAGSKTTCYRSDSAEMIDFFGAPLYAPSASDPSALSSQNIPPKPVATSAIKRGLFSGTSTGSSVSPPAEIAVHTDPAPDASVADNGRRNSSTS